MGGSPLLTPKLRGPPTTAAEGSQPTHLRAACVANHHHHHGDDDGNENDNDNDNDKDKDKDNDNDDDNDDNDDGGTPPRRTLAA